MTTPVLPRLRAAAGAALLLAATARAGPPEPADLDFTALPRLLDTHLARYGKLSARAVTTDTGGFRIRLPAKAEQTGVYSYFALAGGCEVVATYELVNVPPAKDGYGASVGLAFDADPVAGGGISVQRGEHPDKDKGSVLWVVRSTPGEEGKTNYEASFYPCAAKKGRIGLRREKAEVVALAGDTPTEELRELTRVAFPAGTVRPVRLFADTGGSPTVVDVRILNLSVKAQELTGGIPEAEKKGGWWTYPLGVVGLLGLGSIPFVVWWRAKKRADRAEPEEEQPTPVTKSRR